MKRLAAYLSDAAMCGMMYILQRRHRLPIRAREDAEQYLERHAALPSNVYFSPNGSSANRLHAKPDGDITNLEWEAPILSSFPENQRCRALLFPCKEGWKAPTVLMLHALMSASDRGYRQWAREFNARGWNAVFVHLPFHYSRTPRRHLNGELAITADIVRTAEGLRSGVIELRQLMAWLRERGSQEFGLWACSYGGWIGALLAGMEKDFRWISLLEPIVDLGDALWRSDAGRALRRHLVQGNIPRELIARFQPLVCPSHTAPAGCEKILIAGGLYDRIARPAEIRALSERWPGSRLLLEPQGHFGFRLMRSAWKWLEDESLLER